MGLRTIFRKPPVALLLLGIVLFALALRLYHLDFQSLWVDEIASMIGANPELMLQSVIDYSVRDQPPAFFILLHGWFKIFPYSDFSGRMFSVVVGIPGIIAMFFLGKEIKDKQTGLIASTILAVNYIHIFYSQDIRFYTLLVLFSTLSYLFYIRAAKSVQILDFVFYSLSTTVLLYTHYFGLVVFATQGILFVLVVIFYPVTRRFVIASVASALIVTAAIIPWIPIFFSDAQTEAFWIPAEPFYFPIKYFYVYFRDAVSCIVFASMILFYFFNQYQKTRTSVSIDRVNLILVGWALFSFLIPVVYSLIQTPMLQERYTLIALPALIVMIALGLRLLQPRLQSILLITTCTTALISLVLIQRYYSKPVKENWRGITKAVISKGTESDMVISPHASYCNYYFKTLRSPLHALYPLEFVSANQKPEVIWWLDGFSLNPVPDSVEANLLKRGYSQGETDSLFRTRATYYEIRP